jgi:hypothetical protein
MNIDSSINKLDFYDLSCFNMETHNNDMDLPDIYDLSHFNKKTHNIVVSIKYNMIYNHLEITYDGETTIVSRAIRKRFSNIREPEESPYIQKR